MRDIGNETRSVVDIAQIKRDLTKQYAALRDAERAEESAGKALGKAQERAREKALTVGRLLIEARKAFPWSGPKAGGWGQLLRDQGIEERSAQRWMALAGYVGEIPDTNENVSGISKDIPTTREVQQGRRDPDPAPKQPTAPPTKPAWTEEAREEVQLADIRARQPAPMPTREERTRKLLYYIARASEELGNLEVEGLHLTDATTSDTEFQSAKGMLLGIVRVGINELEGAGALDAPEPQKRQLLMLVK